MQEAQQQRVVVVLGPTATGKSAFAVALAERIDGEIVNADALQLYRGLEIGTARPSLEQRRTVPHHLYGALDPRERSSAGAWARAAQSCLEDVWSRGRQPIVVGGSGLYLRALLRGLTEMPAVDERVRQRLSERCEREGLEAIREELEQRDPESARRLHPGDRQRHLRALEVLESTGRSQAEWIAADRSKGDRWATVRIGLTLPRALLYDRISVRVREMFACGWVDEVSALLDEGVPLECPAFQAIGYRSIVGLIAGKAELEEVIEQITRETRQYAKRQMTWFRRDPAIEWLDANESLGQLEFVMERLERLFRSTPSVVTDLFTRAP